MLFDPTEVHVELMQMFQKCSERCALCHLSKSIDILGKTLAAIAKRAIRTRDVGVSVIDIARKKHSSMHLAPVGSHLLAILAASVERGDLVGSKYIVHIIGQLSLQWGHDGELLTDKNRGEQIVCAGEDHGLLLEVLNVGTLGEEFGHIMYLVAGLTGKPLAGAGQDGGTDKHRDIWEFFDELRHQS